MTSIQNFKERAVNALGKSIFFLFVLGISSATHAWSADQDFIRLRSLSDAMRVVEFGKLDRHEKIELFFIANRRRPPYSGFDVAIAQEDVTFISQLRIILDNKGGTPEVLDYLSIVAQMKRSNKLVDKDIKSLKLDEICSLAPRSNYCPVLLNEILFPAHSM
jgi:hypothetical protein